MFVVARRGWNPPRFIFGKETHGMLTSRKLAVAALALSAVLSCTSSLRAVEPDKFIPPDAESVTVVNLKQTLDSAIVKKYALDVIKSLVENNADAQNLTKATGLNLGKDIDALTITTTGGLDGKLLLVVRGRYDAQKLEAAAANYAKTNPNNLKIGKEGSTTIYESNNDGKTTYAAVADTGTLLASGDRAYLVAALKRAAGPTVPPKKELTEALAKIGGKESIYTALIVTDDVKKTLAGNDQTKDLAKILKTVTATLMLTDAIQLDITATATTPQAAQQLTLGLNAYKQAMPGIFKTIGSEQLLPLGEAIQKNLKVAAEANIVTINLKLTEDVFKKAFGQ
jgi:hypothetical protein